MFDIKLIVHFSVCPSALLSQEQESQATSQSSGPSEKELALEESVHTLQQERDALSLQYQAQVRTSVTYIELRLQWRSFELQSWGHGDLDFCAPHAVS